jgi:hypothetical protein
MKINNKDLNRLKLSVEIVKQSMIHMGCAMKPAADKVVQAVKRFEELNKKGG